MRNFVGEFWGRFVEFKAEKEVEEPMGNFVLPNPPGGCPDAFASHACCSAGYPACDIIKIPSADSEILAMSDNKLARERSVFRLHCLSRLAKLQAKLEDPDWGVDNELELLAEIQTSLTLMLHDLGIECSISEDWATTDRFDLKS
jgi:hypothetical protein